MSAVSARYSPGGPGPLPLFTPSFRREQAVTDNLPPVTPIRPGLAARYRDAQAMNDICALLAAAEQLPAGETNASVPEIVDRCGRRATRPRVITAQVTGEDHVQPVAPVHADGITVLAARDPDRSGVLIQVTTRDPGEATALAVTVDGQPVSHRRRLRAVTTRCGPARGVPNAGRDGKPSREGAPSWPSRMWPA
jgi:hypothetical protein